MRKAFTLIELIFVIVIIGLLAAVAVPKFVNLKQSAEAASVVKTTVDTAQQAVEVATNWRDLENKQFGKDFNLSDIVKLNGKGWQLDDSNTSALENNRYYYEDPVNNNVVAEINMSSNEVNYSIDCTKFNDSETESKCKNLIGGEDRVNATLNY